MKFFTSLHDTLHTVTDQTQISPKQSRRVSTTTSAGARQGSPDQAPEPRAVSTNKRLQKRRRSGNSSQTHDKLPAIKVPSVEPEVIVKSTSTLEDPELQLYRLASLHFSRFNSTGVVLKASCNLPPLPASAPLPSKPLPELPAPAKRPALVGASLKNAKYRHPSLYFPSSDLADDVLASFSHSHSVSLQSSLSDGIWTGSGSVDHVFLQKFMSEEALRHFAEGAVPSLLARRLMKAEGLQREFTLHGTQQLRFGSWGFVLEHFSPQVMEQSNGTHTWIPHRILPKYHAALQQITNDPIAPATRPSSLDIVRKASLRQPATLVIKQTPTPDTDEEISFFSFSKGNHITGPLPPPSRPSSAGWSKLEELALDCFISDADAFRLFSDCNHTLRTAVLNLRRDGGNSIAPPNGPTQMSVLSSLTITSSVPLENLASAFTFPALKELSLAVVACAEDADSPGLGIFQSGEQAKLSAALRFPWSNLARLTLRNSTCDSPFVEDILAQCGSLTSFTWKDRYSTEPRPQSPALKLPLLRELKIDANECGPLLHSITRLNPQAVKRLSLRCCDKDMIKYLPNELTEITIQDSMELRLCAKVLERVGRHLTRASIAVSPGEPDPCQGRIHMSVLRHIDLRGRTKTVHILRSLISAPRLHEKSL